MFSILLCLLFMVHFHSRAVLDLPLSIHRAMIKLNRNVIRADLSKLNQGPDVQLRAELKLRLFGIKLLAILSIVNLYLDIFNGISIEGTEKSKEMIYMINSHTIEKDKVLIWCASTHI